MVVEPWFNHGKETVVPPWLDQLYLICHGALQTTTMQPLRQLTHIIATVRMAEETRKVITPEPWLWNCGSTVVFWVTGLTLSSVFSLTSPISSSIAAKCQILLFSSQVLPAIQPSRTVIKRTSTVPVTDV